MTSALTAWAALLDQSIEQIAELSADARTFDRLGINRLANVWDNNTYPFFHAALASTSRTRRRVAEEGLRWLADLDSDRRAWAIEQTARAGYILEVPEIPAFDSVGRNYLGHVTRWSVPLTPGIADELRVDYDLSEVVVDELLVERARGRLRADVGFSGLRRRYAGSEGGGPVRLYLRIEELSDVSFDADDLPGLVVDVGTADLSIAFGENGVLRAGRAELRIEDSRWHLSSAGRAADATTPPDSPRQEQEHARGGGTVNDASKLAAYLLQWGMLEVRGVYAPMAGLRPPSEMAATFRGSGQDILKAGAKRFGRDAAFRRLIEKWMDAGGERVAPWFRFHLTDVQTNEIRYWSADDIELARTLLERLGAARPAPKPPREVDPAAELLLLQFIAAPHPRASVVIQLATPSDGGSDDWVRRIVEVKEPVRCSFDLRAFTGDGWREQLAGGGGDVGGEEIAEFLGGGHSA